MIGGRGNEEEPGGRGWGRRKNACRTFCQLRARRALSLFKDVPLGTRRALSPKTLYSNSPLLVLNGTSLNIDSALLALNWRYFLTSPSMSKKGFNHHIDFIWQSPGRPGWQNLMHVTCRPHHPIIAAVCTVWPLHWDFSLLFVRSEVGSFTASKPRYHSPIHGTDGSKVSSDRLGNEDKVSARLKFEPGTFGMEVRGLHRSATTTPRNI